MNITKITIGRLYNLGNYEHIRYDLTVEVKEGDSAEKAILALEAIIAGLAPMSRLGVKTQLELDRQKKEVEEMQTMPLADWQRRYGHCTGNIADVIARYRASYEEEKAKTQAAELHARKARAMFDRLSGAAEWRDGKRDWDDYCEEDL